MPPIEDYVTESIIVSENLRVRTPQHLVVVTAIDFCSITAINLQSASAKIWLGLAFAIQN
jgi:hypothetical protein